jgi:hypothetical protein
VVENLHDVRAAERRGRLGLSLETSLRLGHWGVIAFDEFHRARDVEPHVGGVPDRAHAAPANLAVEPKATGNDSVLYQLNRHRPLPAESKRHRGRSLPADVTLPKHAIIRRCGAKAGRCLPRRRACASPREERKCRKT